MLRRFLLPGLLFLVASLPIQAAETALDAISTDASLVIRLKNPKATIAKVADLADVVVPNSGDSIRNHPSKLGDMISNPTLAGVNMESDWWVAVYATGGEQEPDVVFIIPASDLKAMKEALGNDVKFTEYGKFGVYTTDADAATKTAARIKGEGKSIHTLADKDSSALFEGGDVSVFINVPQLAAAYKTDIDEFKDNVNEKIENAPQGLPGGSFDPQQMSEIVQKVLGFLTQGLSDTQSCTVAATISKEGLNFEDLVKLKAGTPTDKLLARSAPSPLANLSALPSGYLGYFGLSWDMSDFTKLSEWLLGAGATGVKPEAAKTVESTLKEMAKLKFGSIATAFGLGDMDEGAVRSVTMTEVDNPTKMRELTLKTMKAMGTVENQGIKQTFTVKPDAEKYGKNSADVVSVKTEFNEADNPFVAALMGRVNAAMFGPDGMTTRVVYLKDRVVQTLGGGKQAMNDVLASLDKKPADTAKSPAQQTRGKLGAKSNLLVLWDIPGTVAKIAAIVVESQTVPIPVDPDAIKELQSKPSYTGLSAATEPQGLRVKTVVPVEQMQAVAKIVKFLQEAGLGGGQAEEDTEEN